MNIFIGIKVKNLVGVVGVKNAEKNMLQNVIKLMDINNLL